ncbi:unnamed protein product, partial [Ectocarpus fasciculatus]
RETEEGRGFRQITCPRDRGVAATTDDSRCPGNPNNNSSSGRCLIRVRCRPRSRPCASGTSRRCTAAEAGGPLPRGALRCREDAPFRRQAAAGAAGGRRHPWPTTRTTRPRSSGPTCPATRPTRASRPCPRCTRSGAASWATAPAAAAAAAAAAWPGATGAAIIRRRGGHLRWGPRRETCLAMSPGTPRRMARPGGRWGGGVSWAAAGQRGPPAVGGVREKGRIDA